MGPILELCQPSRIFPKGYISAISRAIELKYETQANDPKCIIGIYFTLIEHVLFGTCYRREDLRPPEQPQGPKGPSSPPNELEGGAQSILILMYIYNWP